MKYLYVIDLQREFIKDRQGQKIYDNCLKYIANSFRKYDAIVAAVYYNDGNVNMLDKVKWDKMQDDIAPLDFSADKQLFHSGYAPTEYPFKPGDIVDVIGFDTDACVLNECFDLFNKNIDFRILVNGCWSSGGKHMHKAGLLVMRRQFNKAVDEKTQLV